MLFWPFFTPFFDDAENKKINIWVPLVGFYRRICAGFVQVCAICAALHDRLHKIIQYIIYNYYVCAVCAELNLLINKFILKFNIRIYK